MLIVNDYYGDYLYNESRNLVLYGGADSGKSVFAGQKLIYRCLKEENHRFLMIRKIGSTIRKSQYQLIKNYIIKAEFGNMFEFFDSYMEIKGPRNNAIVSTGVDDPEKLKSIEGITGIWCEEPTELTMEDFQQIDLRLRGDTPYYKQIIFTFNPIKSSHWLKSYFWDNSPPDTTIVHSTYLDNEFRDKNDDARYERLTGVFHRIYAMGEWGEETDPDQLIDHEWIQNAYSVEKIEGHRKLGVDVARYGDDDTVLAEFEGNALIDLENHHGLSTDRVAAVAQRRIIDNVIDPHLCSVDGTGLGSGVVDNMKRAGFQIIDLVVGKNPVRLEELKEYKFYNLRSQMYFYAREMFRQGKIRLEFKHMGLVGDLTSIRYEVKGDKTVAIESKDSIKKRLGRSPDYGDAFVYGLFADKLAIREPVKVKFI